MSELSTAEIWGDADLHLGDCRYVLATLPANSVDACVTDPPYGLKFMGKEWDHGVPGTPFWSEVFRVLKPGAHLVAFGGTRTHHRLMCAIEESGFEIRDCLGWLYGSGFPKSLNVGDGWGTALKPAWEPIVLARKPLDGTVLANIGAHGTGAMNIDGCRVEATDKTPSPVGVFAGSAIGPTGLRGERNGSADNLGRWPANIIHDGSDEVLQVFPQSAGQLANASSSSSRKDQSVYGAMARGNEGFEKRGDTGTAARFFYCAKASKADRNAGCDELEHVSAGDATGGRAEGSAGLKSPRAGASRTGGAKNFHPTVKPHDLMRYLCRLVTPPGGVVLDPFMGSGSTGRAALREGFQFIGVELESDYLRIARARLDA